MAGNRSAIKGITIKIGGDTTELGKAMESVNQKSDDLSKELQEINRQLKFDPENTELLAQKQKVLADIVENTSKRLETLREAERQVQAQFARGEVSEAQVRALRREIIATEGQLKSYEEQAKEAAEGTKDLADSADKAGAAGEGMGSKFANAAKVGIGAVVAGAGAAVGALVASAEATREYRTEMGKLTTAFTTAGHSSEAATATYQKLQGILGETEQAVEAANHLAQLADTEEELTKWTDIATGVYAAFGASLPIEGLTEAANETAKTGAITGGLADALNWADTASMDFGISLKENIEFTKLSSKELKGLTDAEREEYEAKKAQYEETEKYNKAITEAKSAEEKFQIALDACTTEQERQALIADTLNEIYAESAENYRETNAEVIRANEANEAWMATMAEAGAAVEPILTDVKMLGASLLGELMPGITGVTDAFHGLINGEEGSAEAVGEALSGLLTQILDMVVELLPTLATAAMSLLTSLTTTLIGMIPQLVETTVMLIMAILDGLVVALPLITQAIVDMIPKLVDALVTGIPQIIDGAVQLLLAIMDAIPLIIPPLVEALPQIVIAIIDGLLSALPDLIEGAVQFLLAIVQAIPILLKALLPEVPRIVDTIIDGLLDNLPVLIDGAIELLFGILEAIPEIMAAIYEEMPSIVTSIVDALLKALPQLIKAGGQLLEGLIKGMLNFDIGGALKKVGDGLINGFKKVFDIHSPSRVMAEMGELLDEGLAVGIEDNAGAPVNALDKLSEDMIDSASELNGVTLERRINYTSTPGVANPGEGISDKLDRIYQAILSGQVIMLDGKTLVGSTAIRYDTELGQRRVLAERGAI